MKNHVLGAFIDLTDWKLDLRIPSASTMIANLSSAMLLLSMYQILPTKHEYWNYVTLIEDI